MRGKKPQKQIQWGDVITNLTEREDFGKREERKKVQK